MLFCNFQINSVIAVLSTCFIIDIVTNISLTGLSRELSQFSYCDQIPKWLFTIFMPKNYLKIALSRKAIQLCFAINIFLFKVCET